MFVGEYQHTIDEKRRISMPAKFRPDLEGGAVVTIGFDKSLVVYPAAEWQDFSKKWGSLPLSTEAARSFSRIMLSGAAQVEFDKLGRMLIPENLKQYAGLGKEATVIGLFNRIEIWDTHKWGEYKAKAQSNLEQMSEQLKDLGI
jgi:MraZ protein